MIRAGTSAVFLATLLIGCASQGGAGTGGGGASATTGVGGGGGGVGGDGAGAGGGGVGGDGCPAQQTCVDTFPFHDERDTSKEGSQLFDVYPCKATADESGPEVIYRLEIPSAGSLSATITDDAATDIDLMVLTSFDAASCIARDDVSVTASVMPGYVWLVADTYVMSGAPQVGPYVLDVSFTPAP